MTLTRWHIMDILWSEGCRLKRMKLIETKRKKGQLRIETKVEEKREHDSLSVLEVSLDDPPVLKSTGVVLVVPQIDPLSCISKNVTSSWVVLRSLVDELLEVRDVVRSDCSRRGRNEVSASFFVRNGKESVEDVPRSG